MFGGYENLQIINSPFPKKDIPPNVFDVSSLPWLNFTGFNLNLYTKGTHLLPIFTIGKYITQGEKTILPFAIQVHHAVCDGYHVAKLQNLAQKCEEWLGV